jgi:hypothetical protein
MKIAFKAFFVLMAVQLVAFGVTIHTGALTPSSMQPLSGCHGHSHKSPLPQQKSYVCCLSGHGSLILQSPPLIAPVLQELFSSDIPDPDTTGIRLSGIRQRFVSSGDPPTRVALRI